MTTINLKDFYPWYTQDEYIEVSEEVAKELRASKRYEAAYRRRVTRNKAQYSLDCNDGIEYSACVFEPSPEELAVRKEQLKMLCYALNSLSEKQERRVEARIFDRKKLKEIAEAEGVTLDAISDSVWRGLVNMRNYLKENW